MPYLRTTRNNTDIIHPPGFYIIGFQTLPLISVYFIFLAFVYAITVVFNCLVIYVIIFNNALHSPKFLAVVNLAVIDLILNSSIIPSMIKIFLTTDNFIPFNLCLVQMHAYYTMASLESYALAILAYDRLVAICFPMRHNSLNTLKGMACIVAVTWSVTLGIISFSTGIMTWLSFCKSVRVFSYFCDYTPTYRLSCNDYSIHFYTASTMAIFLLVVPFLFILGTYFSIIITVFSMKSVDKRIKALTTCVEHVLLVAIFYIPLLVIYTLGLFFGGIDPDHRVLGLSMASCIPPCLNPIIYTLKTKEIRERLVAFVRKWKIGTAGI
uniref:G-protein coupled receptors family 1 profile domain-containing protein n=1 Tax=Neogobius melanostomus TaxID=47308 RepID=A0A8C6SNQ6_9GOBI